MDKFYNKKEGKVIIIYHFIIAIIFLFLGLFAYGSRISAERVFILSIEFLPFIWAIIPILTYFLQNKFNSKWGYLLIFNFILFIFSAVYELSKINFSDFIYLILSPFTLLGLISIFIQIYMFKKMLKE